MPASGPVNQPQWPQPTAELQGFAPGCAMVVTRRSISFFLSISLCHTLSLFLSQSRSLALSLSLSYSLTLSTYLALSPARALALAPALSRPLCSRWFARCLKPSFLAGICSLVPSLHSPSSYAFHVMSDKSDDACSDIPRNQRTDGLCIFCKGLQLCSSRRIYSLTVSVVSSLASKPVKLPPK